MVTCHEKPSFVCRVYVKNLDINSFELNSNEKNIYQEVKQSGLFSNLNAHCYSIYIDFKYGFGSVKLAVLSRKGP